MRLFLTFEVHKHSKYNIIVNKSQACVFKKMSFYYSLPRNGRQ